MVKKTKRFKYEAKKSKEYVVHDEPKPEPATLTLHRPTSLSSVSASISRNASSAVSEITPDTPAS